MSIINRNLFKYFQDTIIERERFKLEFSHMIFNHLKTFKGPGDYTSYTKNQW